MLINALIGLISIALNLPIRRIPHHFMEINIQIGKKNCKKLIDLHKKGVQINFMCYDINQNYIWYSI